MTSSADEIFQRGVSEMQSGKIDAAERSFKRVIQLQPGHLPALDLLSILLARLERRQEAEQYAQRVLVAYDEVLRLKPNLAEPWLGRGHVLNRLGRDTEAIESCEQAIAARSDFTQAHLLRAKLLTDLRRYDDALDGVDRLLARAPGFTEAWLGRSNILFALKRHEEALAACERALALKPDLADAWHGRGNALNALKNYDQALAAYDKALALNPGFAAAWHGRGNVLNEIKRYDQALAAYDKALAAAPGFAEAWLGRGNVLSLLMRSEEAFAAFDRALALIPDLAEAWLGRGNVLGSLKHYDDALAAYDKALASDPGLAEAWLGRGNVSVELKQYENALAAYDKALMLKPDVKYARGDRLFAKLHLSDWSGLDAEIYALVSAIRERKPAISPFPSLAISLSPAEQLESTKCFIADQPSLPALWRGEIYSHDRIRVAYLSADFHEHATMQLAAGLFERHDRSRFEISAISFGPDEISPMRDRAKNAFEHFIDVGDKSDRDIADLVRRLEIDIAVDLKGFTRDSRFNILARRAAPIQVNFLGYPGTMATDYIDYILADPTIIPQDHVPFYGEQVVWLPDSYQVNDDRRRVAERTPARGECGLPEESFVFCCFNNTYKITPEIFAIWMRLLGAKENSVLWLIETNSTAARNLRREVEKRGIAPSRLIFAPKMPPADHLARLRHADLFLDTLPYNAHTTASDALWTGVPVLTCLGATFAGRVAASLLKAIGLEELITYSLQDYEALARKLAGDESYLAALKERLARNRTTCPLFDTERTTRHIEAAYMTMWQRYQRGEAPAGCGTSKPICVA